MSLQPYGVVFRHVRPPSLFFFLEMCLSLFNLPFPAAFKGELVFTQERRRGWMFNQSCCLHFGVGLILFCTLQWRTTGRPASSWHRFRILSVKQREPNGHFFCVKGSLWGETGRHLWILSIVSRGADGVNTPSLEMRGLSCFCLTSTVTESVCLTYSKTALLFYSTLRSSYIRFPGDPCGI